MFNNNFYHELLSKYVAIFGSLFNDIIISRSDGSATTQSFKVPIGYGPREKMLAIVRQKPESKRMAIQLPRISFEITGLQYDGQRKFQRTQKYKINEQFFFEPVPYDIYFELNVLSKSTKDALKIIEQIFPYFNPDWTVSAQLLDNIDRIWDIPIIRTDQSHQDLYEGDFTQRRAVMWTINFTMKAWLHGPTHDKKVIKFIRINTHSTTDLDSDPATVLTIQPGLTANGEPTTDIDETIPYVDIEELDNWDYIIQSYDYNSAEEE